MQCYRITQLLMCACSWRCLVCACAVDVQYTVIVHAARTILREVRGMRGDAVLRCVSTLGMCARSWRFLSRVYLCGGCGCCVARTMGSSSSTCQGTLGLQVVLLLWLMYGQHDDNDGLRHMQHLNTQNVCPHTFAGGPAGLLQGLAAQRNRCGALRGAQLGPPARGHCSLFNDA
jgi:hypothetical protein